MDEDPFLQLVKLLSHGDFDLWGGPTVPLGKTTNHPTYYATLVGLEGEVVQEVAVRAEDNGEPPMSVRMAYARSTGPKVSEDPMPTTRPAFDTVEFEAYARCTSGCCVWYRRTTPLWRG